MLGDGECDADGDADGDGLGVGLCTVLARALLDVVWLGTAIGAGLTFAK